MGFDGWYITYTREPAFNPGPGFLLSGGLRAKAGPRTGRRCLLDPARRSLQEAVRLPGTSPVGSEAD